MCATASELRIHKRRIFARNRDEIYRGDYSSTIFIRDISGNEIKELFIVSKEDLTKFWNLKKWIQFEEKSRNFLAQNCAPQKRKQTQGKQISRKADQSFEKKLLRRRDSLGENKRPFARFMDFAIFLLSLSPAAFNVILCYAHTFFFLCYVPSKSHFSNYDRS